MADGPTGTWRSAEDGSTARIVISPDEKKGYTVSCYDSSDGEEFEISNLMVLEDGVEFDVLVPSNGYRTHNRMAINPDGTMNMQLTLYETWERE